MNWISETVYRAFKEDIDEARKNGREEGREEARREFEEWRRKVAIGCLESGVDQDIVCKAIGYSLYELMDLMDSEIS